MIEKNRFWCQWNYTNKLYYFLVNWFSKSNLSRNIQNWFQNGRLGGNKSNDRAKMNDAESNRAVFYIEAANRERKLTQTVRIIQIIGTALSTMTETSKLNPPNRSFWPMIVRYRLYSTSKLTFSHSLSMKRVWRRNGYFFLAFI